MIRKSRRDAPARAIDMMLLLCDRLGAARFCATAILEVDSGPFQIVGAHPPASWQWLLGLHGTGPRSCRSWTKTPAGSKNWFKLFPNRTVCPNSAWKLLAYFVRTTRGVSAAVTVKISCKVAIRAIAAARTIRSL